MSEEYIDTPKRKPLKDCIDIKLDENDRSTAAPAGDEG
jgi:hypothetical protein